MAVAGRLLQLLNERELEELASAVTQVSCIATRDRLYEDVLEALVAQATGLDELGRAEVLVDVLVGLDTALGSQRVDVSGIPGIGDS